MAGAALPADSQPWRGLNQLPSCSEEGKKSISSNNLACGCAGTRPPLGHRVAPRLATDGGGGVFERKGPQAPVAGNVNASPPPPGRCCGGPKWAMPPRHLPLLFSACDSACKWAAHDGHCLVRRRWSPCPHPHPCHCLPSPVQTGESSWPLCRREKSTRHHVDLQEEPSPGLQGPVQRCVDCAPDGHSAAGGPYVHSQAGCRPVLQPGPPFGQHPRVLRTRQSCRTAATAGIDPLPGRLGCGHDASCPGVPHPTDQRQQQMNISVR